MTHPLPDLGLARKRLQALYDLADRASGSGVLPYLNQVVIDSRPEPSPFRTRAEPWQWSLAGRLAEAFEYVSGLRTQKPSFQNYWLGLPKGHDKSSLVGRLTSHALAYARKPWNGYVAAADKEQAGYLAEAMQVEASLNPWLRKRLHFKNWVVTGAHDSTVHILAADAAGSQGIRPDLLIFDEIVHWKKPDLYYHVASGQEKRPGCVKLVLTNAGFKYTWCWDEREIARKSSLWSFYEAPGSIAGWMDKARINELRKSLPEAMGRRLYSNVWIDPGESCGYLTREEAQACEDLGVSRNLCRRSQGKDNLSYVAAVDYGEVKDRCVMVVLHEAPDGVVEVDQMEVWQGSRADPVPIAEVERWLDNTRKAFDLAAVVVDPYQMVSTIQKFQGLVPVERWTARAGAANYEMAQAFRSAAINNQLAWYKDCGTVYQAGKEPHTWVEELTELFVKPTASGFRVQHHSSGHDDRFVAGSMAICALRKLSVRRPVFIGDMFW